MPNTRIITITGRNRVPGADHEVWNRFLNWGREVYMGVINKAPERLGTDHYGNTTETPEYPEIVVINHLEDLVSLENSRKTPDYGNVIQEFEAWRKRGIAELTWSSIYELVKGYRNTSTLPYPDQDTRIDNAPIMHLEAYRLTSEDSDKYNKWFNDYALNIFIPFFMRLPGLKGYDYFRVTGVNLGGEPIETDYPFYLSIVYFETIEAYQQYAKSPELDAFRKNLRSVFPRGLLFKWWTQYELVKSYRK